MEINDVLYTVDNRYIDIMLGSIYSLLLNGNLQNARLHLITSNFSLEDYQKVENAIRRFFDVEILFYDIKKFNIERFQIPN